MSIYEKNILVKLYHNESLRKSYLLQLLPALFTEDKYKMVGFVMRHLYEKNAPITIENIILTQRSVEAKTFIVKQKIIGSIELTIDYLYDLFNDIESDSSDSFFKDVWDVFHEESWRAFVIKMVKNIEYDLSHPARHAYVISYANAIAKAYRIIFRKKLTQQRDQIHEAAILTNKGSAMIPFFSKDLNRLTGGVSRGHPTCMLGRSEHCKSTLMTYDSIWKLDNKIVDKVYAILVEENASKIWQRVFACKLGIPMSTIVNGLANINPEQIEYIKKLYQDKLIIIDNIHKFTDIIDLLNTIKAEYIWIDHVNGISFGKGSGLKEQIDGIPSLIQHEKIYLAHNKDTAIVNLSQVNERNLMERTARDYWKMPKYTEAYGSSAIYQAAREFFCIYYPNRDKTKFPQLWQNNGCKKPTTRSDIYINADKNSHGDIGEVRISYDVEYQSFSEPKQIETNDLKSNINFEDLFK